MIGKGLENGEFSFTLNAEVVDKQIFNQLISIEEDKNYILGIDTTDGKSIQVEGYFTSNINARYKKKKKGKRYLLYKTIYLPVNEVEFVGNRIINDGDIGEQYWERFTKKIKKVYKKRTELNERWIIYKNIVDKAISKLETYANNSKDNCDAYAICIDLLDTLNRGRYIMNLVESKSIQKRKRS